MSDEPMPKTPELELPSAAVSLPEDALTELEALDQDAPNDVLKTFGIMALVATVICLIPRQFVPAGTLFLTGVVILIVRRLRLRAEKRG
jgi:hypothetical protein